jgi:hypothetical protein
MVAEFEKLSTSQRGSWLLAHKDAATWESGRGRVALNKIRLLCPFQIVGVANLPAAAHVSMPYDVFLNRFRTMVAAVGEDPASYSTHSMRRGGATEMRERDVPEELIAQHGGWKSKESMMKYFDGSVELLRRAKALQKVDPVWKRAKHNGST